MLLGLKSAVIFSSEFVEWSVFDHRALRAMAQFANTTIDTPVD
jgi:hypothetical protein